MTVAVHGGAFQCPDCGRVWNVEYQHHLHIFALVFKCPCKEKK